MTPLKLYLSGPMRGYPDLNRPAFADAAAKLRALGHLVHNPAENDAGNLRANLAIDAAWICLVADAVVFLPGWRESRGAVAEDALRVALELPGWELGLFLADPQPSTGSPIILHMNEPLRRTAYQPTLIPERIDAALEAGFTLTEGITVSLDHCTAEPAPADEAETGED